MTLYPVEEILKNSPSISVFLQESEKYYAHKHPIFKPELLEEHIELVGNYFSKIVTEQNIDVIIDGLIFEYISPFNQRAFYKELGNSLKSIFCNTVLFHDYGKINENFQADKDKMANPYFQKVNNGLDTKHSELGTYLFIVFSFNELNRQDWAKGEVQALLSFFILFQAYCIQKHHAPFLAKPFDELPIKYSVDTLCKYVNKLWGNLSDIITVQIPTNIQKLLNKYNELDQKNFPVEFPLYALVKLNYSLLTASDYIATTHYMSGWDKIATDFGIMSQELKMQMVANVKTSKPYNQIVYNNLNDFVFKWPTEKSNQNLNCLRTEMAIEVIQNIKRNLDKHLFYIEAPTGGGKTNLSMIALAELLSAEINTGRKYINKVFYVFPFTTLITQTYKSLKETFLFEDTEITQIHSKAGLQDKHSANDDQYGKDRLNYIDYLFANYPIILLSHIKFFEILKTNNKEENYLLHRLANSVVIIDELQSYNPSQWDKVMYMIDNYARLFNIKFILMSATLPKIGKLLGNNKELEFTYLITDKSKYFMNENFKGRVTFDFSLHNIKNIDKDGKSDFLNNLAQVVLEKSNEYYNNNGRVFSIIEFIFKKTATEFFKIAQAINDGFFDKMFILSGTILEPRRREIIEYIKNPGNREQNILLVTTQVVEAGVDIDMDLGFKDSSIVDSDEQLAGRINRNVNKAQCTLYVFNCDSASILYKKDLRFELLNNEIANKYETILSDKDFDLLYDAVINIKNTRNDSPYFEGLNSYKESIRKLDFPSANENFKLIDQANYSIFIPLDIPIRNPENNEENNFTESELLFLEKNNKHCPRDDFVYGQKVWEFYEELITSYKNEDFLLQKSNLRNIQGIMSKFIISIFAYSKDVDELKRSTKGYEKYGYFYLSHWYEGIYDYESGLDIPHLNYIFL